MKTKSGVLVRSYANPTIRLIVLLSLLTIYGIWVARAEHGSTSDTPRQIKRLSVDGFINAVAWNADGSRLAALSDFGGKVTIWDAKTWNEIGKFTRYGGPYSHNSFEFLPDGNLVVNAPIGRSPDPNYKTLSIFSLIRLDANSLRPLQYIPDPGYVLRNKEGRVANTFTVSPDGTAVAAIVRRGVTVYGLRSGLPLWQLQMPLVSAQMGDFAESLAFTPDGQQLIVGTLSGRLNIFRMRDGSLLRTMNLFDLYHCSQVALSPDGQLVAVGKNKKFNVPKPTNISTVVYRLSDGGVVSLLPGTTVKLFGADEAVPVWSLAWKPKSSLLAVGDAESLHIWRISRNGASQLLDVHLPGLYSLKYSPSGTLAVGYGNHVAVFE